MLIKWLREFPDSQMFYILVAGEASLPAYYTHRNGFFWVDLLEKYPELQGTTIWNLI